MTDYVKITLLQNIPKNVSKLILTNHEGVKTSKKSVFGRRSNVQNVMGKL